MRRALFASCVLLVCGVAQKDVAATPRKALRPNIVIILADGMGYGDVTVLNSYSRIPTPNLDR